MGIDMVLKAGMRKTPEATRQRLGEFFRALKPIIPGVAPTVVESEEDLAVSLIPDHWFQIGLADDEVTVDVRTNVLGPGYHDYVVRVLEEAGKKAGLVWKGDGEGSGDETGYWDHRDFAALKKSMVDWLSSLSFILLREWRKEKGSGEGSPDPVYTTPPMICMMSPRPLAAYDVCHPQGPLSWEDLTRFANNLGEEDCRRFFMWWDRSDAPTFFRRQWRHPASLYRNFALCAMWNSIPWAPIGTEAEWKIVRATLQCLDLAWRRQPKEWYPAAEWAELVELAGGGKLVEAMWRRFPGRKGEKPGIGYLRHDIVWDYGGMYLKLPGAMHRECEPGEPDTYWNEGVRLRVSAFRLQGDEPGAPCNAAEWFALEKVQKALAEYSPFTVAHPDVTARVLHQVLNAESNPPFMVGTLTAAVDNVAMQLFAYYGDEEGKKEAEAIFAGVAYQPRSAPVTLATPAEGEE